MSPAFYCFRYLSCRDIPTLSSNTIIDFRPHSERCLPCKYRVRTPFSRCSCSGAVNIPMPCRLSFFPPFSFTHDTVCPIQVGVNNKKETVFLSVYPRLSCRTCDLMQQQISHKGCLITCQVSIGSSLFLFCSPSRLLFHAGVGR